MRFLLAIGLTLPLAACNLAPDFLPKTLMPATYQEPQATGHTLSERWWEMYGSGELNRLMELALANSSDISAAMARINQAEASLRAATASLWPNLSLGGGASVGEQGNNGSSRSFRLSGSASYELDFWGRNRAGVEAAQLSRDASHFDRDTVLWTLTGDVASAYFTVLALNDRLASAEQNLELSRQTLTLTLQRVQFGQDSGLEAAQQQSAVANIEAQVTALRLSRVQAVNALTALLGQAPGQVEIMGESLNWVQLPVINAGLPSQLLQNRPDLRSAEARLMAANVDIGAARAQYLPSFSLTAEGGWSSRTLSALLDPASALWSVGVSGSQALFDGGRISANIDQAQARREELEANYAGQIINALRDVEDGLASHRMLAEQEAKQALVVAAAREAQRIADIRYRSGAVDFMALLDAERTLLSAEDQLAQLRLQRLNASVNLAKSLGGPIAPAP